MTVQEIIREFVPVDYQATPEAILHYFKTLPDRNFLSDKVLIEYALSKHTNGVDFIIYHPYHTTVKQYKWSQLKSLISATC